MTKEEALPSGQLDTKLHDTIDSVVWTKEWLKTIANHPEIPTDEGAMIGWFANAIMAGYDKGREQAMSEAERIALEYGAEIKTRNWHIGLINVCGRIAKEIREAK